MELSVFKLQAQRYQWPHFVISIGEDNNDRAGPHKAKQIN